MKDESKTKRQLIDEVRELRRNNAVLEKSEIEHKRLAGLVIRAKKEWEYTFDSIPDLIALIDRQHRIIRVNKAMANRLGLSPKEAIGRTCYESVHNTKVPPGFCPHVLLLKDGNVHTVEVNEESLGGDFLVSVSPLYDEEGNVVASVHIARDITGLKTVEKALKESEEKYRNIFENAVEGIFQTTPEGSLVSINPALAGMYGYDSPEELMSGITNIGEQQYVNPEDRIRFKRFLEEKGHVEGFETRLYRKDGSTIWVSMNARVVWDNDGAVLYYEGIAEDISERKGTEERLLEQLHFLQVLIDSIPSPVFYKDAQGVYVGCNKAFESYIGQSKEQIIGKTVYDVTVKEVADVYHDMDRALYGKPGTQTYETVVTYPDGSRHNVIFNKATYLDMNRSVAGLVGVILDITDLKNTEAALRKAKEGAEVANRAKSEFLASMSHEIRTPMNAIIGMGELLLETPLSSEQQKYVQVFRDAGENLLGLINDILDLSKVEAGQVHLEVMDFDLVDIIERTCDVMALRTHEKNLELVYRVFPDVPTHLTGDPTRLRQVLVNLIGNAIKFTEKGEIALEVRSQKSEDRSQKSEEDRVQGSEENRVQGVKGSRVQGEGDSELPIYRYADMPIHLQFSVRDTGIGISSDKIDMIFKKFTQVDASTTRKYGGTGLGLAISRRFVELMGGRIWVESEVGVGTTMSFTACFNIQKDWKQADARFDTVRLKDMKVLVIDDNATNRMILREMLNNLGASVTEAEDGRRGLKILEHSFSMKTPFQLLLLDYFMPAMDGFEVMSQIQKNNWLKDLSVIILTSGHVKGDREKARQLGVSGLLRKPVKKAELIEAINIAMNQSRPAVDAVSATAAEVTLSSNDERRPLNVLIAEDNEDNRLLVWSYFRNTPHKIHLVENGQIAVEKIKEVKGRYDLVFMDMQMPVMDGYTATSLIRVWERENGLERTPIVALTAFALQGDEQKSLDAGCDGYVTKPIKKAKLFETIATYARKAKK